MIKVTVLHFQTTDRDETEIISLLGQRIEIRHICCQEDVSAMAQHIREADGSTEAIALVGAPRMLRLGKEQVTHNDAVQLFDISTQTPVVDGSAIQSALERWAIRLVDEQEPGIWAQKNILMTPGLNHGGMAEALQRYTSSIRYADPVIYFGLPSSPGVGSKESLSAVAGRTLAQLKGFAYQRLFPQAGIPFKPRSPKPFEWAQVLAGDIGTIRRYAPDDLQGKTIVCPYIANTDYKDLRQRGASILVTTLPNLSHDRHWFAHHSAAEFEACLAALAQQQTKPLTEDTYLNLMADLDWQPVVRYIQPEEANVNRFAYITQPLNTVAIKESYRWTRLLPAGILARTAAHIPPVFLGRASNLGSKATKRTAEGVVFMLGGTPEAFSRHDATFVYRRLLRAADMAAQLDARILGVSSLSEKLGEASEMVSHKTDIPITSGRSLMAASALEAAKWAHQLVGSDTSLSDAKVVAVKATRPSVAACARYLAPQLPNLTLVASRPEKLIQLKQTIENEAVGTNITISTNVDEAVSQADIVVAVAPISADDNARPFDITTLKPGAIVCDLSRPPAIRLEEAALRPDVLIIHASKFRLPGEPELGADFGFPHDLVHPSFAETVLLALEGRFQDFSLGKDLEVQNLREIMGLAEKHGFQIAGIRSYERILTEAELQEHRQLVDEYRHQPDKTAALQAHGREMLESIESRPAIPQMARDNSTLIVAGLGVFALIAGSVAWFFSRRDNQEG